MTDKRKRFRFFAVLLAGIGVLAIFIVCLVKFMPTGKHMTSEGYFGQLGQTVGGGGLKMVSHCAGTRTDSGWKRLY